MTDNEKIIMSIRLLKAENLETAVTMEQIIEKGIKMGYTKDYTSSEWKGYKEGDHPWYPHSSIMMGIGPASQVASYEEIHLHRQKVKTQGDKRKKSVMVYWYDPMTRHETKNRDVNAVPMITTRKVELTLDEKKSRMEAEPGKYRMVGDKLLSEAWIAANPEKFKMMYGEEC